jgi:hypothetical protein
MARMKYHYHIVTPFSRPEHFKTLADHLRPQVDWWHILLDDPLGFELAIEMDWMEVSRYPKIASGENMWRRCINRFAEQLDEGSPFNMDNHRYLMLSDDTLYESGFFEKIDQHEGEVVIASLKRGDQIPPGTPSDRSHGTNTLIAAPEYMKPCSVDSQQLILSGRLFRRVYLPLIRACDGVLIESLVHDYGANYAPEAFVLFNRLEPGRWNEVAESVKPT